MNPYECAHCGGILEHESDCPQRPAAIKEEEKLMQC